MLRNITIRIDTNNGIVPDFLGLTVQPYHTVLLVSQLYWNIEQIVYNHITLYYWYLNYTEIVNKSFKVWEPK